MFFFILSTHASHISGGEIYYSLVSQSGNDYTYAITLKLLRDATGGGPSLEQTQSIAIYEKRTNTLVGVAWWILHIGDRSVSLVPAVV